MEEKKKLGRGLEEVSHLFLSRQDDSEGAERHAREKTGGESGESLASSESGRSFIFFFSPESLFTEKSFLACNLALELAKRSFSVGVIETNSRMPNAFFLLGSLFTDSAGENRTPLLTERPAALPPTLPTLEPGKIKDVSLDEDKKFRMVFLPGEDFGSSGFSETIEKLSHESDFLIINSASEPSGLGEVVIPGRSSFIVPTTVNSEELLRSYSLIKHLSGDLAGCEIGLLIMKEDNFSRAEAAFKIMAGMVAGFLPVKIDFLGIVPSGVSFSRSILARIPLILDKENSPLADTIRGLADRLIKKSEK